MKDLHEFLAERLARHQERLRNLRHLSQGVARALLKSRDKDHWDWPYSCGITDHSLDAIYKTPANVEKPDRAPTLIDSKTINVASKDLARSEPSISTQAMICASIDEILLKAKDHDFLTKEEKSALQKAQQDVEVEVLNLLRKRKGPPFLFSSTFGDDDIFTASWLLRMYHGQKDWPSSVKEKVGWPEEIKKSLVEIIGKRIINKNGIIDYERGLFVFEERLNEAGPHSLPLLKVIQALEIIRDDASLKGLWQTLFSGKTKSVENAIRLAGDWLEKNLHRQMSFYRFKDFRFDAAELIFCLHGSIITGQITSYESIVDNVLDVVREAQERSVYWRPYRPMTSSSQGGVLLPLSIEVAMALLKTLRITKKFLKYEDTLEEYSKWLFSQRLMPSDSVEGWAPSWVGWHSENAYEFKVIHVWDTALVGAFLCDHLDAIDTNFQDAVLKAGSFTFELVEEIDPDIPVLEQMITPDAGLPIDTKTRLLNDFIPAEGRRPEKFSLLIFGPPGSSKTTLAKALAKSLNWPLVYLSPTNFIKSGEAGIERQAKDIFDALGILRNKVIFFDEIDRLILDRDSNAYGKQGDMFQFMTPGMLTKISDLRQAKRCVFIIATNYEEHIDRAIKRKGRIDESIPWLPMDLKARTDLFQKFIDDSFGEKSPPLWPELLSAELRDFAKKCVLRIYPELRLCFKNASTKITVRPGTLQEWRAQCVANLQALGPTEIPAGDVSLESYKKRTKKEQISPYDDYVQGAYLEYSFLLILQGESQPEGGSKSSFQDLMKRWEDQDPEDFNKKLPEVRERLRAYGLQTWLT